jgi:hypothetical protein
MMPFAFVASYLSFALKEQGGHEGFLAEARYVTEALSQLHPSSPDTM